MNIRVEKRLPFGFKGEWGKCYKLTNYNNTIETITYSRATYFDIGFDVQIKEMEQSLNKIETNAQPIQNLVTKGEFKVFETTDAYFNGKNFECVISENDLLYVNGEYWIVEKIETKSIFNPAKQSYYYLHTKKIFDEIIIGAN